MSSLNLLLLRLILDQPKIIINSQSKDLIGQINLLCSGSVLDPVQASVEEMQSVVFILSEEGFPPFSFPDISNVWVEEISGVGRIQFRKISETFRIGKGLAGILIEFRDMGYWSPDSSFSISLMRGDSDSGTYVQGIKKRIDFLSADNRYFELVNLENQFKKLSKNMIPEEIAFYRLNEVILRKKLAALYKEKFESQEVSR